MLSVVSVFNDPAKLEQRLRAGLDRQTRGHEFLPVDNREGRFPGAAAALNHGAAAAKGEWVMFVHQDVELLGGDWLERAEGFLAHTDPAGWAGVVGRTDRGRWRGMIRDRAMVFGEPADRPTEVQTLDEVLLMTRNRGPGAAYFDDRVPGWHAYGVDACLTARAGGARNHVLPVPVWHDSASTNLAGLREAQAYVWGKHRRRFRRVYTTCGRLPDGLEYAGSYRLARAGRRLRDLWYARWIRAAGSADGFDRTPWEVLEQLTAAEPVVRCLHRPHPIGRIEGIGFTDRTAAPRRVVHEFAGLPPAGGPADPVVVVAPELAPDLAAGVPRPTAARLLVCVYLDSPGAGPAGWAHVFGRSVRCHLGMERDETRWAVLEAAP